MIGLLAALACMEQATALLAKHDPDGLAIVRESGDEYAAVFLACDQPGYGVAAMVHESLHLVNAREYTARSWGFRLAKNRVLRIPRRPTWPRSAILPWVPEGSAYRDTYLVEEGKDQGLESLLDELLAYTRALQTDRSIASVFPANRVTSSRDGVANMLWWLGLYFRCGRESHPQDWQSIADSSATLDAIQEILAYAEKTLALAMTDARLGIDDVALLEKAYSPKAIGEIERLFEAGNRTLAWNASLVKKARSAPRKTGIATAEPGAKHKVSGKTQGNSSSVQVSTHTGSDGVTRTTVKVLWNGEPKTRADLEAMLRSQPLLKQDPSFLQILELVRQADR